MEWTASGPTASCFTSGPILNMASIAQLLLHAPWQFVLWAPSCDAVPRFMQHNNAHFHAITTAMDQVHWVTIPISESSRCFPAQCDTFLCARLARLSRAHQHIPTLTHSCVLHQIALNCITIRTRIHHTHTADFAWGSHQMHPEWGHSVSKSLGDVGTHISMGA